MLTKAMIVKSLAIGILLAGLVAAWWWYDTAFLAFDSRCGGCW
jgi:hypothetical protein